ARRRLSASTSLRSGFRQRAAAALTPAKRLKFDPCRAYQNTVPFARQLKCDPKKFSGLVRITVGLISKPSAAVCPARFPRPRPAFAGGVPGAAAFLPWRRRCEA